MFAMFILDGVIYRLNQNTGETWKLSGLHWDAVNG